MIDCIIPLIHFASRTQAALAGAVTMLRCLPEKLNPVIKPLMESIKKEDNEQLQVCWDVFHISYIALKPEELKVYSRICSF